MPVIDNQDTFIKYKGMTATERNIFNIKEKTHYKIKEKFDKLIKEGVDYPVVINIPNAIINTTEEFQDCIINTDIIASVSTPITDPPLNKRVLPANISQAVNYIVEKSKSKSKNNSVVFNTDGEPPPTYDIPNEWNGDKQNLLTNFIEPQNISPIQSVEPNDLSFLSQEVINNAEIERQALTETLNELSKARQELKEAREKATKIIAEATADAEAERQITNAQAQAEAQEIREDAKQYAIIKKQNTDEEYALIISRATQEGENTKARMEQEGIAYQLKIKEQIDKTYTEAKEAEQSLIKRGGEQGNEIANRIIAEANLYYKKKVDEADAYKPPYVKGEVSYVFDDVDGIYQFYLSGDYKVEVNRHDEKLFTIQEVINREEQDPIFRIKL